MPEKIGAALVIGGGIGGMQAALDLAESGIKAYLAANKAIYRRYPQAIPAGFAINKLGHSPCRVACPAGQRAQGYIALIREKRYEDAYKTIVRDNPFPSVCGRVCKHYCEEECTRQRG